MSVVEALVVLVGDGVHQLQLFMEVCEEGSMIIGRGDLRWSQCPRSDVGCDPLSVKKGVVPVDVCSKL